MQSAISWRQRGPIPLRRQPPAAAGVVAEAVAPGEAVVQRPDAEQVERQPSLSILRLIHPLSRWIQGWVMTGIPRRHQPRAEVGEAVDVEDAVAEQAPRRLK
jgi:hypothetical protein